MNWGVAVAVPVAPISSKNWKLLLSAGHGMLKKGAPPPEKLKLERIEKVRINFEGRCMDGTYSLNYSGVWKLEIEI